MPGYSWWNGRALPNLTESVIVQERLKGPNTANDGVPANSSLSSSPPAIPPLPLLLSRPLRPLNRPGRCHGLACGDDALPVQHGECRSPTCAHLVGGWAHGASATIAAAAMPRSPRWWRVDMARRPVLYVPGQCLKVRHGHVARGILVVVVV